jgi:hypothetical protein
LKLFKLLTAALVSILFYENAKAGVLVEPFVGYGTGSWKLNSVSTNQSGVDYGGRLGWNFDGFLIGGDYVGGSFKDNQTGNNNNITAQDIGGFLGFEVKRVTVRGAYNFNSQGTYAPTSGTNSVWKGNSFSASVGFAIVSHISLNLDFMSGTYDTLNGVKQSNNLTNNIYSVRLSFPFESGKSK